ncbi:uncharacterized protein NPIL_121441 [Nephila pilipes]|uniref:Uncharacterized protein n=1 Tax=Nephila pilipes TaxID=299642 RepID=A0A8X6P1A1_NEPPI|nr:uncharacterized protein NPIL_121441 [Nephila pilipes]
MVEFTEASGLSKDICGIFQCYLTGDLDGLHIMVKYDAFHIFCQEMEMIQDQLVVLPFWCLCDGLVSGTGQTQHRYMIVASKPESSFEDIWKHIVHCEIPSSGAAKKCVKIQDNFLLVRIIMYVSQRKER